MKSVNKTRIKQSPLSNEAKIWWCSKYTMACEQDFPGRENCLSSNWSIFWLHTESNVKPSINLATWQVRVIGLRSFSIVFGSVHFGQGVTCDSLSCDGATPCLREVLWISERTGASPQANSFQILLGTTSGPGDLFNFTWLKALKVFLVSTRNSLGTSSTLVVGLVPQGSKVCSKISQEGVEKLTKYSRRGYGIIQHLIIPVMRVLSTCDPFYFFPPPLNIRILQCCYLVNCWFSVSRHSKQIKKKKPKPFNRLSPESGNTKKVDMQRLSPRFRSQQFFLYGRYVEKRFPQIYRDLYGAAMLVPT